jgi:cytochrome c2
MKSMYVAASVFTAAFCAAAWSGATAEASGSTAGDPVNGQKVYAAQKCNMCHKIGTVGGPLGPALTAVGTKRDAAWLAKYLVNPKAENPKNKMPAVKVKGQELDDLVAYLLTLKGK